MNCRAVILAAGHGTRMKSAIPKVLHPIAGRTMLSWVIKACRQAADEIVTIVVGSEMATHQHDQQGGFKFVEQSERLGTGHALHQAEAALKSRCDQVLVVNADMPLLRGETLVRLVEEHARSGAVLTLLAVNSHDPRGFGRLVRDKEGNISHIVEEAHASPAELQIQELNAGAYCFEASWLWRALPRLELSPKGEYYLTDLVKLAAGEGLRVGHVSAQDEAEKIGVNTRIHLAEAEAAMRERINQEWMGRGVTLQDPATTYIGPQVQIGRDSLILPNTHLEGETVIGENCRIGPNSIIRDSRIGDGCEVEASVVEGAQLAEGVDVGPFSHLREGAILETGVHVGNFGEIKNSHLGPGVKVGHFSYLGDATIGADVNIGAGTVTCNFDGEKKNPTTIDEDAFIGSDTMLVAPVRIGSRARTGAGSVVTKDVPADSVAVGVPARTIRRIGKPDE